MCCFKMCSIALYNLFHLYLPYCLSGFEPKLSLCFHLFRNRKSALKANLDYHIRMICCVCALNSNQPLHHAPGKSQESGIFCHLAKTMWLWHSLTCERGAKGHDDMGGYGGGEQLIACSSKAHQLLTPRQLHSAKMAASVGIRNKVITCLYEKIESANCISQIIWLYHHLTTQRGLVQIWVNNQAEATAKIRFYNKLHLLISTNEDL